MKEIIATQKFKRSFRKLVKRNAQLEQKIIEIFKIFYSVGVQLHAKRV